MSEREGNRRGWRIAAVAGVSALALAAGGVAWAAVAGAPTTNTIGLAGYASHSVDPAGFTDVQEVNAGDQYALTAATGTQGVATCDTAHGVAAAVGEFSSNQNTNYQVKWGVVNTGAGCPQTGPVAVNTFPNLAGVPFGHHVWVDITKVTKVKRIRILICILHDRDGGIDAGHQPDPVDTGSPEALPAGLGHRLHGDFLKCFIIVKKIEKDFAVIRAQDLDAPSATPLAGDLPGVQTQIVKLPKRTVFDGAVWGISANSTSIVPCTGLAADLFTYPRTLAGPAAYVSGACQPAVEAGYMTAREGAGASTDPTALTTAEVINRAGTAADPATVAPDNSLTATTPAAFPHGTAPDASTAGGHDLLEFGNAPVS
jgi:hypothetical protein